MRKFLKSTAAAAFLAYGLVTPALAQSASEMAVRMQQLEDQVRSLMGQVEQLNYEVQQMKAHGKSGAAEQLAPPPAQKKITAAALAPVPSVESPAAGSGVEMVQPDAIESLSLAPPVSEQESIIGEVPLQKAPGPKVLGALDNAASAPGDGGFQGKVLVPPSQQEPGDDAFLSQGLTQDGAASTDSDAVETVSLSPETPEALYEKSNESLLRRQFGDAEAGFSTFLSKYPEHGLAGSAQYWLGETYYAQSDFKRAAQTFLRGYKNYPKSRRAADSLLKLGISLSRLGQTDQACAAYGAVSAEYPKAVEARKRAQAEAKRAGCAA